MPSGFKVWATGDLVNASDFNNYVQEQVIMTFADSSARDSAVSSAEEGMFCFLKDTNVLQFYNGSSWASYIDEGDITSFLAGTNMGGGGTSGAVTLNLDIDAEVAFGDNIASGLLLKDYAETDVAESTSSGVLAIDLSAGNTGTITLTENVTDIDFTNVPTNGISTFTLQITNHASSPKTVTITAVTVNGGGNVTPKTAGGAGYTMTASNSAIDLVTFLFVDAGTPLLNALQNFS